MNLAIGQENIAMHYVRTLELTCNIKRFAKSALEICVIPR